MDMAVMATFLFAVPRRAADAGMDAVRLGWLSGVFFITYAVVSPLVGKLSDRFGRKRFMVAGMMVAGVLMWACAYETRFEVLLALCGAAGAAAALFWPTLIAWFSEGRRRRGLGERAGNLLHQLEHWAECWLGRQRETLRNGPVVVVRGVRFDYACGAAVVAAPDARGGGRR